MAIHHTPLRLCHFASESVTASRGSDRLQPTRVFADGPLSSSFLKTSALVAFSKGRNLGEAHLELKFTSRSSFRRQTSLSARHVRTQRSWISPVAALVENRETQSDKRNPSDVSVLVVGSTGYIGKFVTKELISRGYKVIAVSRERSGINQKQDRKDVVATFGGADVRFGDVTELQQLQKTLGDSRVDVVVSCLASRTGGIKDSWKIDYEATTNSLLAGKAAGAKHFVLLSAICVQKPLLEFQRAKLKFEEELQRDPDGITFSVVRPTAFFKSLGGQVESVRAGGPYVMFGDGQLCACKPISEADLASFIADCITDEDKQNKVLPIGGPGEALTPLQQGEMLFDVLQLPPKFIKVPLGVMDFVIGTLDLLSKVFPNLEDAVEYGRIGRYYASESMLLYDEVKQQYDADATPSYGKDLLRDFFDRVAREGMAGQELGDQAVFKAQ
eukprot:TRINITY_DN4570_c0_g1_i1.p1 TRINITY_DN4570_c0_g1~~TRINITY_DN4570_c0_g1_i1.p1  ORF type:complete len:444 (-),score=100.82 TRINITY_DN4570_c0_g1_i1:148-1479(-)